MSSKKQDRHDQKILSSGYYKTTGSASSGFAFLTALIAIVTMIPQAAPANVIGVGAQNFNPTPDGLDFVTVQSSQVLSPGIFNFGFFVNNAWNTLPYLDTTTQSRVKLQDSLLGADVNLGVGLLPNWEVGISLPAVISQTVHDQGDIHGQFTQSGSTEVRLNTKYRVYGSDENGLALVGTVNFNRVTDDPYSGSGAKPTYNLDLAGDHTFGKFIVGANLGRRFRTPGSPIVGSPIEPLRGQWTGSIAASRLLSSLNTKIIGEIFGAAPAEKSGPNATRNQTSAELLVGAKHDLSTQLALHAGLGTALVRGVSSPDWRVYVGLNYAFGPLWGHKNEVQRIEPKTKELGESQARHVYDDDSEAEGVSVASGSVADAPEAPESPGAIQKHENFAIGNILFEFNSAELADGHEELLAPLVSHLKSVPFKKLDIEGYTDSVGKPAYNLDLSRRRSQSVRNYLIKFAGLTASKITASGFGATHPIASNSNYQGRQANRRVEFKIEH